MPLARGLDERVLRLRRAAALDESQAGSRAHGAARAEAWAIAQKGGPGVTVVQQGARTAYTIEMGRRIGFVGGTTGAALGNPAAFHIRVVLQGLDVITAFPVIP